MAEGAIVSAVLRVLHETIGSPLIKDFGLIWGVNEELLKLQSTLTTIEAVLADAEELRVKDRALDNWLRKLRDVAYQADNVLDDFRIEALRQEAETGDHILKKVRDFFSNSNQLIFKICMGNKLKEVGNRLISIANERKLFHLKERVVDTRARTGERETFSYIDDPMIFGREGDREKIVQFLMTNFPNDEDVVSVIAIVGMGGLGKTTLAKLAYNDTVVEKAFDLRMWVCVSDDFDVMRLIRSILNSESGNETMEQLQRRLREKLSANKFLLVLDDVWNENPDKWETLRGLLQTGVKGSKIVLTTRNERIASMMSTVDNHILKGLSDDDCWALFEKRAFFGKRKEDYPELTFIGKEIVKKCHGLPLAAKTLGSIARSRKTQSEWMAIRDSEIWQLRDDECGILPGLMLSYYNLPSHLKSCFVYCALFPKDSMINEDAFTWLWMAEGLIPSRSHGSSQNIGKTYLKELVSMSLFQVDDCNKYYVHDLVHDLAKYVARGAFFTVQVGDSISVPQFCHCLTVIGNQNTTFPKKFCQTETLRTLIILEHLSIEEVTRDVFFSLSKLRALDLKHCVRTNLLPDSIGSLKHLRYINLSSGRFRVLPRSICSLRNLQVLLLSGCFELESLSSFIGDLQNLNALDLCDCRNIETLPESMMRLQKLEYLNLAYCNRLQELPKGLSNMRNLRNLNIHRCTKLTHMPAEMGKLNSLEKLSTFIMDEKRGCSIAELQHLNLGGELEIINLGKLKNTRAARQANMKEKHNMQSLALYGGRDIEFFDDVFDEFFNDVIDDEVLEGLEAPQNIVKLKMRGGTELPGWLKTITESSFPKLIEVNLMNFKGCKHLPPLGQLQHLEKLNIDGMASIEVIGKEFCGSNGGVAFPVLKSIDFTRMLKWKKWLSSEEEDEENGIIGQQAVAFPSLTKLEIYDCPELTSLPPLPSLQHLHIERCPLLTSLSCLPSRQALSVGNPMKLLNLGGKLEIKNLGKLKNPRAARQADMKEKHNMQSLALYGGGVIDDEVLEGLEAPQNIVKLEITELPGWLKTITESSFPKLIEVNLMNFKGCKHLPPLGQLQHLEKLNIDGMDSIEVVGKEFCGSNGGIAFPSLKHIVLQNLPKLKKWLSSSEEDGIIGQQALTFPCLTELRISICPELTSLPHLPSLQKLTVGNSRKLLNSPGSFRGIGANGSLKKLLIMGNIFGGRDEEVLEGLQDLSSVEDLGIRNFGDMDSVMDSMRHLFSTVRTLYIRFCKKIRVLPETMRGLVSLQSLRISVCHSLSSLGEGLRGLTALQELYIEYCYELGCMPEYMGSLTSLQYLRISYCPHLERRCEREKGEDWHLISHIPNITIFSSYEEEEEEEEEEEATGNLRLKKKVISVVKERLSACIPSSTSST